MPFLHSSHKFIFQYGESFPDPHMYRKYLIAGGGNSHRIPDSLLLCNGFCPEHVIIAGQHANPDLITFRTLMVFVSQMRPRRLRLIILQALNDLAAEGNILCRR